MNLFFLLFATLPIASGTPSFSVTDLGQPAGSTMYPYGLNNSGVVVGQIQAAGGVVRGWAWENGILTILPTIGGLYNTAFDVNDSGQVVGFSTAAGGATHGVIWENGAITDVGNLGHQYTTAYRIGNDGSVIGHSSINGNQVAGYVWRSGAMTNFGSLGGTYIEPRAINASGVIAGWSYLAGSSGPSHAFISDGITITSLGSLGGNSAATAINDSNVIVGMAEDGAGGPLIAFRMDAGGIMQSLGAPYYSSRANDINNNGWITGWARDAGGTNQRGFLYIDGQFYLLNDLIPADSGWFIIEGSQINHLGQIAARAILDGQERAILLTPAASSVPEPGSAALLGVGLLAAAFLRRTQREAVLRVKL